MLVDLHLHTNASDGTWTLGQIFDYVRQEKVQLFSVTDHDLPRTVDVPDDLLDRYVPGVEIDAHIDGRTAHLLVYGSIAEGTSLQRILETQRQSRRRRVVQIVQKLQNIEVPITLTDVLTEAGPDNRSLGRPHIASALVAIAEALSVQDAFDRYLAEGEPAYVGLVRKDASLIIRAAHDAGATVVLAHPQRLNRWDDLDVLCRSGIDGIEVAHPSARLEVQQTLAQLALQRGLLQTGGSDCHGHAFPVPVNLEGSLVADFKLSLESCLPA